VTELGSWILFVEGRLGHAAAPELESVMGQCPIGAEKMIIDLSGVDYLSSAVLRLFAVRAERQLQKGGRLLLRAPSISARLALDLAGLLFLVESESEAAAPRQ
jgi:stage II sporulation protein AA (anti-sigma F factor antagonist)